MATAAQIAANRLNAQKSTGPRTPVGKAIVSRNGLKHATFVRKFLLSDPAAGESSAEFQALCDEYYDTYTPVGPAEELLLKQMVKAAWRMSRFEQAETAEITLSLKSVTKTTAGANHASGHVQRVLKLASLSPAADITDLLAAQDEGCELVLDLLGQARQMCQRDQRITREMLETVFKSFGAYFKSLTDPLTRMMEEADAHCNKPDAPAFLEQHQRDALAFLDGRIGYFEQLMAARKTSIDSDVITRQHAALLPEPQTLNKLLRFEATLERQFYRALDQLQKLQSRRLAKTPASLP